MLSSKDQVYTMTPLDQLPQKCKEFKNPNDGSDSTIVQLRHEVRTVVEEERTQFPYSTKEKTCNAEGAEKELDDVCMPTSDKTRATVNHLNELCLEGTEIGGTSELPKVLPDHQITNHTTSTTSANNREDSVNHQIASNTNDSEHGRRPT